jgi:hypothetical protein
LCAQLVQALRYESPGREGDTLLNLLVARAEANLEIANYLHWYALASPIGAIKWSLVGAVTDTIRNLQSKMAQRIIGRPGGGCNMGLRLCVECCCDGGQRTNPGTFSASSLWKPRLSRTTRAARDITSELSASS